MIHSGTVFAPLLTVLLASSIFAQDCDTLTFLSNGSKVTGCFYAANSPHPHTLLFTQGFMATGDLWGIGKTLSSQGINVFMFDFRGCFRSEGRQGLINSQEDIGAALAFLSSDVTAGKYRIDRSGIVVGGYSYGGHMSMVYAIHHPEIKRIISISGGDLGILAKSARTDPDVRKGYSDFFASIRRPKGPVDFAYQDPFEELLENQGFFSILDQAEELSDRDILMTGGLDDEVVSMETHLLPLYRKLKKDNGQRIRFIVYQTDHSYRNVSDRLIQDVSAWILEK
jgi:pimeloyl-ACP methyl ester carboxylesterase